MMVAEREPLLNGNMLAYVIILLVSLLVIAFVVIVVLVCRQKNRTGVCLHSTCMHPLLTQQYSVIYKYGQCHPWQNPIRSSGVLIFIISSTSNVVWRLTQSVSSVLFLQHVQTISTYASWSSDWLVQSTKFISFIQFAPTHSSGLII